jgi:hypothetical protein
LLPFLPSQLTSSFAENWEVLPLASVAVAVRKSPAAVNAVVNVTPLNVAVPLPGTVTVVEPRKVSPCAELMGLEKNSMVRVAPTVLCTVPETVNVPLL